MQRTEENSKETIINMLRNIKCFVFVTLGHSHIYEVRKLESLKNSSKNRNFRRKF